MTVDRVVCVCGGGKVRAITECRLEAIFVHTSPNIKIHTHAHAHQIKQIENTAHT